MNEHDKKQPVEEYKTQEQPQYAQNQDLWKEQQLNQSWEKSKNGGDDIEKIIDNFKRMNQKAQEEKAKKMNKKREKTQYKLRRKNIKSELKKIRNEEKSLKQNKAKTKQQSKNAGRER
ncbi:MAG: hypothetical protein R3331_05345 [Sulfurospirillaceae bacterium]|nr:hypothetical protein [Sulfurospirillaceae bacterium]